MRTPRRRRTSPDRTGWIRASVLHAASVERWKDANALFSAERYQAAIYMAGYVLECHLKYTACAEAGLTYVQEWEADIHRRTGRHPLATSGRGHNLGWLRTCDGLDHPM